MRYDQEPEEFEEMPDREVDFLSCPIHILTQYLAYAPPNTKEYKERLRIYNIRTGQQKEATP